MAVKFVVAKLCGNRPIQVDLLDTCIVVHLTARLAQLQQQCRIRLVNTTPSTTRRNPRAGSTHNTMKALIVAPAAGKMAAAAAVAAGSAVAAACRGNGRGGVRLSAFGGIGVGSTRPSLLRSPRVAHPVPAGDSARSRQVGAASSAAPAGAFPFARVLG